MNIAARSASNRWHNQIDVLYSLALASLVSGVLGIALLSPISIPTAIAYAGVSMAYALAALALARHRILLDALFLGSSFIIIHLRLLQDFLRGRLQFDVAARTEIVVASDAIRLHALYLEAALLLTWFVARLLCRFVDVDVSRIRGIPRGHWKMPSLFLLVGSCVQGYLSLAYAFNLAGVASRLPYQSLFFYLLPVDFVVLVVAMGVYYHRDALGWVSLGVYCALKAYQGWKVAPMLIGIVLLALYLYDNRFRIRASLVVAAGLVGWLYVEFGTGLITSIRLARIAAGAADGSFVNAQDLYGGGPSGISKFYDRLAGGVDFFLLTLDRQLFGRHSPDIGASDLIKDFVDGLMPASIFGDRSFFLKFSEEIVGQEAGAINEFSHSVLGTSTLIHPLAGVVVYVTVFAFVFSGFVKLAQVSRLNRIAQALLLGYVFTLPNWIIAGGLNHVHRYINAVLIVAAIAVVWRIVVRAVAPHSRQGIPHQPQVKPVSAGDPSYGGA